jgi:hypothetical protein
LHRARGGSDAQILVTLDPVVNMAAVVVLALSFSAFLALFVFLCFRHMHSCGNRWQNC